MTTIPISEHAIATGAIGLVVAAYGWIVKRQIARIDALEKSETDAKVLSAKNIEILANLVEDIKEDRISRDKMILKIDTLVESVAIIRTKMEAKR